MLVGLEQARFILRPNSAPGSSFAKSSVARPILRVSKRRETWMVDLPGNMQGDWFPDLIQGGLIIVR